MLEEREQFFEELKSIQGEINYLYEMSRAFHRVGNETVGTDLAVSAQTLEACKEGLKSSFTKALNGRQK